LLTHFDVIPPIAEDGFQHGANERRVSGAGETPDVHHRQSQREVRNDADEVRRKHLIGPLHNE
jgi:hypothetical protein